MPPRTRRASGTSRTSVLVEGIRRGRAAWTRTSIRRAEIEPAGHWDLCSACPCWMIPGRFFNFPGFHRFVSTAVFSQRPHPASTRGALLPTGDLAALKIPGSTAEAGWIASASSRNAPVRTARAVPDACTGKWALISQTAPIKHWVDRRGCDRAETALPATSPSGYRRVAQNGR